MQNKRYNLTFTLPVTNEQKVIQFDIPIAEAKANEIPCTIYSSTTTIQDVLNGIHNSNNNYPEVDLSYDYTLKFTLSDGTTKEVAFTVPVAGQTAAEITCTGWATVNTALQTYTNETKHFNLKTLLGASYTDENIIAGWYISTIQGGNSSSFSATRINDYQIDITYSGTSTASAQIGIVYRKASTVQETCKWLSSNMGYYYAFPLSRM